MINLFCYRPASKVIHAQHFYCLFRVVLNKQLVFFQKFWQAITLPFVSMLAPCFIFFIKFFSFNVGIHLSIFTYNKTKRQERKSSTARGYNYRWQKVSKLFLDENPLCKFCSDMGIIRAAEVVDHITPHKGNQELFWNTSNWQGLCIPCHNITKQRIELLNIKRVGEDGWPIEE